MSALATTTYRDPEVAALARDLNAVLNGLGTLRKVEFVDVYTEPMTLQLGKAPFCIFAVRIQPDASEDTVLAFGAVSWTWVGGGNAQINDIAGLTVGTKYRFRLLVVE